MSNIISSFTLSIFNSREDIDGSFLLSHDKIERESAEKRENENWGMEKGSHLIHTKSSAGISFFSPSAVYISQRIHTKHRRESK